MPGLPNSNPARWRRAAAETGLSLFRVPIGTRPRRMDAEADRRAVAARAQPTQLGPEAMRPHLPPLPPCPQCRRLTGVEEDESTCSSLLWFFCRCCGDRWSVSPQKLHQRLIPADGCSVGAARSGVVAAGSTRRAFGGALSEQLLHERDRDLLEMGGVVGRCSHRDTVTGRTRYRSPRRGTHIVASNFDGAFLRSPAQFVPQLIIRPPTNRGHSCRRADTEVGWPPQKISPRCGRSSAACAASSRPWTGVGKSELRMVAKQSRLTSRRRAMTRSPSRNSG
jgi:hypothetical protein